MIDAPGLQALSVAQGVGVGAAAYSMVGSQPQWWLGRMAFVEQRWQEVADKLGLPNDDNFKASRLMFREQFVEACAAAVRRHYGV